MNSELIDLYNGKIMNNNGYSKNYGIKLKQKHNYFKTKEYTNKKKFGNNPYKKNNFDNKDVYSEKQFIYRESISSINSSNFGSDKNLDSDFYSSNKKLRVKKISSFNEQPYANFFKTKNKVNVSKNSSFQNFQKNNNINNQKNYFNYKISNSKF